MKLIKINSFHFIKTNNEDVISKAQLEGLEIIEIIKNPLDYDDSLSEEQIKSKIENKEDVSLIRPEMISQVRQKIEKNLQSLNNKEVDI